MEVRPATVEEYESQYGQESSLDPSDFLNMFSSSDFYSKLYEAGEFSIALGTKQKYKAMLIALVREHDKMRAIVDDEARFVRSSFDRITGIAKFYLGSKRPPIRFVTRLRDDGVYEVIQVDPYTGEIINGDLAAI